MKNLKTKTVNNNGTQGNEEGEGKGDMHWKRLVSGTWEGEFYLSTEKRGLITVMSLFKHFICRLSLLLPVSQMA